MQLTSSRRVASVDPQSQAVRTPQLSQAPASNNVSSRTASTRSAAPSVGRTTILLDMRRSDVAKRMLDVVCVVPLIVLCLPFWFVIAFLIKFETPGPVLFRQARVGLGGRPFTMYKFRSMVADAERHRESLEDSNEMSCGILFKMKKDPRVTRLGHVLRRWSLDETPQFLNVLLGQMSLVGPRPPVPAEVAKYTVGQRRRLHTKPGLTCFWQIYGRSEIPFASQVRLDVLYIKRRSLWLDLKILAKTIPAVLGGRGAF